MKLHNNKSHKILLFSGVLLIISFLLLGGTMYGIKNQSIKKTEMTTLSIVNWKTLKNTYGWKVKYPPEWKAHGHGYPPGTDISAETDASPTIVGPSDCYDNGLRCGNLLFDTHLQAPDEYKKKSPKEFLLNDYWPSSWILLDQGEIQINKYPGYYITYNETATGNRPNGQVFKDIAIKSKDGIFTIRITEDFKVPNGINSEEDWQLTPVFNQILSTFEFLEE